MKLPVLCLALGYATCAWSAATTPTDAAAVPEAPLDLAAFAEAVAACQPSNHAGPHPFVKGYTIEHAVTGEEQGSCRYSQSMPGDMRMECALSSAGREGLAEEFRQQAQGKLSGGTSRQPEWTRECEIVDKSGKRSPLGG